jgi:histidinol phosphatase-like PHP family hydrolase
MTPPVAWQPTDCHAHTRMSDGALDPDELVHIVRGRGVRPSIADHLTRDIRGAPSSVDAVARYLDELDRHAVLRGGEFCWQDSLWRELPDELFARFTHRLGSLHAIFLPNGDVMHAFASPWPDGLEPQGYMDAHLENLERFAREMPVEILAHPTLLPMALRKLPLEELWTEAREERAVAALAGAGIAFEISNRYRPHERFVAHAIAGGVRISLGSDGHTAQQVGDVAWPLALARRLGAEDDALYDPLVHGRRSTLP